MERGVADRTHQTNRSISIAIAPARAAAFVTRSAGSDPIGQHAEGSRAEREGHHTATHILRAEPQEERIVHVEVAAVDRDQYPAPNQEGIYARWAHVFAVLIETPYSAATSLSSCPRPSRSNVPHSRSVSGSARVLIRSPAIAAPLRSLARSLLR